MYNLDNILINKILGYLEPQKLVYNQPNTIISSYPHVSIIDIALVCKHWFELISKMLIHLGIHIIRNPQTLDSSCQISQISAADTVYIYPYNDRYDYSYIDNPLKQVYKSVDFYILLNSRHSLLNFNNIRSLYLNRIDIWNEEYDQLINRIIHNGQLKTFTVVSEISYLKSFIKKFKPTTFQYFVVTIVIDFQNLTHKNIWKSINFLMKPKYNITWMETFISNLNDYRYDFTGEAVMNGNDLAKYLQAIEKAAPISPIRMFLYTKLEKLNILNDHLKQITTLQLYYLDIMDVINIIKNCSQLKELYIKMFLPGQNEIENQLSELLKNNRSIENLKIINGAWGRTNSVEFSNHFSDVPTVNTTLTRLSLDSFFHISEKLFQSLESNTTVRSLSITLYNSMQFEYFCHSVSLNNTLYKLKINHSKSEFIGISVSIGKLLQSDTHNIKIIKLYNCYFLDSKPIEDAINSVNSKSYHTKKIYLIVNHKLGEFLPKNSINGEDIITIKVLKG